jgi:single-strand DNA-binding protein
MPRSTQSRSTQSRSTQSLPSQSAPRNEVTLVGRLAAAAVAKELPSGDQLTVFRLVVTRGPSARPVREGGKRPTVDTFECVAWAARAQRLAQSWQKDDVVEVHGALRRRFYRAGAAAASVWEVEVGQVKRVAKAG